VIYVGELEVELHRKKLGIGDSTRRLLIGQGLDKPIASNLVEDLLIKIKKSTPK
jgi:hypothetical protein